MLHAFLQLLEVAVHEFSKISKKNTEEKQRDKSRFINVAKRRI